MAHRLMFATCAMLTAACAAQADIGDPTQPPPGFSEQAASPESAPATAALVVSGLFLMGDKPYAMVDGQIVRTGDPLAEGKVARIDASGVWIRLTDVKHPTGLRQLKLLPEVVKTPSKARMEKK